MHFVDHELRKLPRNGMEVVLELITLTFLAERVCKVSNP